MRHLSCFALYPIPPQHSNPERDGENACPGRDPVHTRRTGALPLKERALDNWEQAVPGRPNTRMDLNTLADLLRQMECSDQVLPREALTQARRSRGGTGCCSL